MDRMAETHGTAALGRADRALLAGRFQGALVGPEDAGYDAARAVWNGMVDKHPALIAFCTSAEDVAIALDFAQRRALPIAVRAGGHNIAGCSVCDDGLVIDLSRMKAIAVDPERRVARAEAGLNLGEFDAATQRFGLATTMGVNSDTGIAGLTLGGGLGRLARKHGLACDNLLAAELVTADGRRLRASAAEHADLFWALRGGGGNFGVVTAFEYRLHPLGPTVVGGSVLYPAAQARAALQFYDRFAREAPDALSVDAAVLTLPSGAPAVSFSACYCGPPEEGEAALRPLRTFATPIDDQIGPRAYLDVQCAADAIFPRGRRYFWKAQFLRELTAPAIEAMLGAYAGAPSARSLAVLQQVGGAIARVPADATAYANRDAAYDCFAIAIWQDPAQDAANLRWARDFWAALNPFATGGVYANNLGEEGAARVRAAYGPNFPRLAALKRKFDPTNRFRGNQNIPPAA
jgi:FAD/FMN-containing dehydrogenase